mgnify:CR=1 FL=1
MESKLFYINRDIILIGDSGGRTKNGLRKSNNKKLKGKITANMGISVDVHHSDDYVYNNNNITRENIDYSKYKGKFDIKLDKEHVELIDRYISELESFYNELDDKRNFNIQVETKMLENILNDVSIKK